MKTTTLFFALCIGAMGSPALADDRRPDTSQRTTDKHDKSADVTKPKLDTAQVMKISQDAVKHIAAAERALARNDKATARSALAKSEQALAKLYDTPALAALVNELDEAIRTVTTGEQNLQALDLAPIATRFRSYQSFMDPELAAGIERARERARQNDAKGTEEALRMVRDRVAVEIALLPVEEAYVRVLAAQQALRTKDARTARRLIQNLPLVVSEVEVSRPLVPIRFKLHAAAEAAQSGEWQQAQRLIREVAQDIQRIEGLAKDSSFKSELTALGDEVERLSDRMQQGTKPQPKQIRELATRTRTLVDDDRG